MTHANLYNLAGLNPFKSELWSGNILSCGFPTKGNTSFVFANSGKPAGSGTDPEKDDENTEKKKEEEKGAKADDEKEKKRKEDEEKEQKKKEKGEESEGGAEDIETTTERISRMARSLSEGSEKAAEKMKTGKTDIQKANAEKMKGLSKDFSSVLAENEKAGKPTKAYLDELVTKKKISRKKAKEILDLDPLDENFESDLEKATKGIPDLEKDSAGFKKIKELKGKEGKKIEELDKKLAKSLSQFRELSNEMGEILLTEAEKERAIKRLSRATGLNLEPGQVLIYKDETGKTRKAKIKEITFEEIEIMDEEGNVIKKIPTNNPKVIIESLNPVSSKIENDAMSRPNFNELIQDAEVYEELDSMDKLKKSLGCDIKKGSVFEYQDVLDTDESGKKGATVDGKVEVKEVNDKTFKVVLDKEVSTAKGKKKEMNFGEFAKWYKQKNAVPEIENIDALRRELYARREFLNNKWKRNPAEYPPIEAKKGEVLYYDDDSGREFVIKEVSEKEKKITFDNGTAPMSFAAFLRWVKDEEVEKKDPDAEAKKRTGLIGDPAEKAAAEKAAKATAEKEIDERIKNGKEKLPGYVFADQTEHAHVSTSYLRQLWRDTHLLSISDLFEMGKTIWELIKRRWLRRQKGRIGAAGQLMFGGYNKALGAEFKNVAQSAENEEVNHHVHIMETQGITDVKHELHHPPDKDTFKAAITVMCKKGYMRWDDEHFWHALEQLSGEHITKENHLAMIKKILDKWWGDNTFNEFRNSQTSSYNSTKKQFEDDAKRLENDPKGLKGRLQELLFDFINGRPVHPCEYEAYLSYAFDAGKMAFESKMFFFIMGVGAKNKDGETLLHIDRVAAMEGDLLAKVPLIDFFVSPWLQAYGPDGKPLKKIDKKTGKEAPETGRPNVNTFRYWIDNYIMPEIKGGSIDAATKPEDLYWQKAEGAPSVFADFVRDQIAWDPYARSRAEKASRDPSNWDHDDMDMFVHLLDEGSIDQLLRMSGGARMQVSYVGLRNSYAGLNEFMRRKINDLNVATEKGDEATAQQHYAEVIRMLKAFIRFDATLDKRYAHANDQGKVRFSDDMYNMAPLCASDTKVIEFVKELRELTGTICKEVGMEEDFEKAMKNKISDKTEQEKQHALMETFGGNLQKKLQEYTDKNGMKKLGNLFAQNRLRGLTNKTTERGAAGQNEMEELKAKQSVPASDKPANDNDDFGDMSMAA